jgi:biopolymer transport protein ExbB
MSNALDLNYLYHLVGPAGLILTILAIVAVYLIIKTWIYLYLTGRDFHKTGKLLSKAPACELEVFGNFPKNPVITIICDVVKTHGLHSNDIKAEVAYLFQCQFAKVLRDLSILRVIALISPMLGLLGTLLGLSGVFKSLAAVTSLSTSTVLAAGIWEAILTTIMGLTVAIPTLIANYLFRLRLKGFHLVAIEYSYRFLDSRHQASKDDALNGDGFDRQGKVATA